LGVTGNWDRRLSRRTFIGLGGMSAAALLLNPGRALSQASGSAGYGALVEDPGGVLDLPPGFQYRVISEQGTRLSNGAPVPGDFDGMAAFPGPSSNTAVLVRNHELRPSDLSPTGDDAPVYDPVFGGNPYDPAAPGGTTGVVVNLDDRTEIEDFVTSSGTLNNCAGGATPWGTWLTCEETFITAGATWSGGGATGAYEQNHGYVFEVFPGRSGQQLPKPIKAFGRFEHEAIAVEPNRTRAYLTEDSSGPNGLVYRWTAPRGVRLGAGIANELGDTSGAFEAMQILLDDGSVLPDVAYITSAQLGRPFKVAWTPVPDREATGTPIRGQFADGTVTRGKKFEGIWSADRGAYIVNSFAFGASDLPADATKHDGMVWYYDYDDETITLVTYFPHNTLAEGEGPTPRFQDLLFDGPDNVSVTPWGTLVLAEDGVRASHVLSAVPGGPTYAIARNQLSNGTSNGVPTFSEFTGPTFSPDGKVLFVNIQSPGITLAITGPWSKYLG
jgi:uncharacterized protein